jgi:hypothetical protein
VGNGETIVQDWAGDKERVLEKYADMKATADAGGNIAGLSYQMRQGRATLVARFGRTGGGSEAYGDDVTVIEELFAVDVLKDICCAPYFAVALAATHPLYAKQNGATKGLPLSDDQVAFVRDCVDRNLTEFEINAEVAKRELSASYTWTNWSTGMKELRWHLQRGIETFYETGFILRQSLYGVRTSSIKAAFTGLNTVAAAAPEFDSRMDELIEALPSGEWLIKPVQCEHLGRGKWKVSKEWQWAEKWSIVFGGTLNGP